MSNSVNRRDFLSSIGLAAAATTLSAQPLKAWATEATNRVEIPGKRSKKPYGSGYFGEWITDPFGLPAYHYTCDQVTDPKAVSPVDDANFRTATNQIHQVGNDRLVATVSNYGYVQVHQDEGGPKFLNDYAPDRSSLYGAGIGYLTDGRSVLSTFYPGNAKSFDRIFGMGYLRKKVAGETYSIDQVIFAPFSDDPVMVSQVTIANHSQSRADLRWVEYWGCQMYQFSYRSWMERDVDPDGGANTLRRDFSERFSHQFQPLENGLGLIETKHFLGRAPAEERLWPAAQRKRGVFIDPPVAEASMEDLHPPAIFLVSLDAKTDGFATDAREFFGAGGVSRPTGLIRKLGNNIGNQGPESAFLLERGIGLEPGQSHTMYFIYGYLPKGADLSSLIKKYQADPSPYGQAPARSGNEGVCISARNPSHGRTRGYLEPLLPSERPHL
jgi:hypothetical protein